MGLSQDFDMDDASLLAATTVTVPFPAPVKQAAVAVNGVLTDVMAVSFADKIMITITQQGRLAQWVTVPLLNENPAHLDGGMNFPTSNSQGGEEGEDSLLPTSRFQPRTLLGAGSSERETMGQLYASQLAGMITTKNPDESRQLLLGLGLAKVETDRDVFLKILNLALEVL